MPDSNSHEVRLQGSCKPKVGEGDLPFRLVLEEQACLYLRRKETKQGKLTVPKRKTIKGR